MSELRKDPVTGRWVIISTERRKRPSDFRLERPSLVGSGVCPLCVGREDLTPPEEYEKRREPNLIPIAFRPKGAGRPTKRDRREIDAAREE